MLVLKTMYTQSGVDARTQCRETSASEIPHIDTAIAGPSHQGVQVLHCKTETPYRSTFTAGTPHIDTATAGPLHKRVRDTLHHETAIAGTSHRSTFTAGTLRRGAGLKKRRVQGSVPGSCTSDRLQHEL